MSRLQTIVLSLALVSSSAVFADTSIDTAKSETDTSIPAEKPYPEFSATYKATWRGGWIPVTVEAQRTLKYQDDNTATLMFEADSAIAGLQEISQFTWQDNVIQPQQYKYLRTGLFDEPDRHQVFDWQNKKVTDIAQKKDFPNEWHDQIQDNLSYNLQAAIDLKAGKTQFNYPVFDRKRVKDFRFQLVGFESLNSKVGTLRTVKVEQVEPNKKKNKTKTYIWFAKDYDYILVRLKQEKKDGQTYQIDMTRANINGKTLGKR